MAKSCFTFFGLKTCAYAMVFINLLGGLTEIIGASAYLPDKENRTQLIVTILLGIMSLFNGILLALGIFQDKAYYILLYLLFGSANLLTVTIYSLVTFILEHNFWLVAVILICIGCWYGHLCIYNLYEELVQDKTVNAGVIEIAYNANTCYANAGAFKEESL